MSGVGTAAPILIVGCHSFAARLYREYTALPNLTWISHTEIDQVQWERFATVVNFALHPAMFTAPYDAALDVDRRLAQTAAAHKVHYVCMSSRAAYAPEAQWNAQEDSPLGGISQYGRNKVAIEAGLTRCMPPEQLTILRIGNIMGYVPSAGRPAFVTRVIESLRNDHVIRYDTSPFVRRDFLPAAHFAQALDAMIGRQIPGIINIGSGIPLAVGHIAMWILEGAGQGTFLVTDPRIVDEFLLDVSRLVRLTGASISLGDVQEACFALGKRVFDA